MRDARNVVALLQQKTTQGVEKNCASELATPYHGHHLNYGYTIGEYANFPIADVAHPITLSSA
jgi:hypothetical protein